MTNKINYLGVSLSLALIGLVPLISSAAGTLAEEEAAGKAIVEQVQSKAIQYSSLDDEQFELVGEYAMGLMMGAGHEAMNQSLSARFGETGERAMHIQTGKQFLGAGYGSLDGSSYGGGYGMMGNWGGYGGMMGGGWGGMMGGYGYSYPLSGFMSWVAVLYHILIIVLLVLAIAWFAKRISSKK